MAGVFFVAGFFALVLRAVVFLAVALVFRVAMFVFPLFGVSRCSALATVANGTTQLPLVRKHIQRCVRVIPRTFSARKNGRNYGEPDRRINALWAHCCAVAGLLAGWVDRSFVETSVALLRVFGHVVRLIRIAVDFA